MTNAYRQLVESGFVGGLKRDVLLEAARDCEFITNIRHDFSQAGDAAQRDATFCTVELISELLAKDLCMVVTRSANSGTVIHVDRDQFGMIEIVQQILDDPRSDASKYVLVATEKGQAWIQRYLTLESEL